MNNLNYKEIRELVYKPDLFDCSLANDVEYSISNLDILEVEKLNNHFINALGILTSWEEKNVNSYYKQLAYFVREELEYYKEERV
tara:strand:+ start:380 stop:634 length:255 start_codon:yes stop_codon:yes gene_type:complete